MRQGRITISDLPALLRAVAEPRGVRGLTRSLIALLIVVLAAFALTATALSGASDAIDLRKTIVTSLLTVLATVAGFYFGSRTAQTSAEDARQHTGGTPAPQGAVPTITEVDPRQGAAGTQVTIRGSGLTNADILFGTTPATVTPVDDTQLRATAPTLPAGAAKTVSVIAVTTTGHSASTPNAQFTYL